MSKEVFTSLSYDTNTQTHAPEGYHEPLKMLLQSSLATKAPNKTPQILSFPTCTPTTHNWSSLVPTPSTQPSPELSSSSVNQNDHDRYRGWSSVPAASPWQCFRAIKLTNIRQDSLPSNPVLSPLSPGQIYVVEVVK